MEDRFGCHDTRKLLRYRRVQDFKGGAAAQRRRWIFLDGMGAGRKTPTMKVDGKSQDFEKSHSSFRNLQENELGGAIFGCNNITMSECLSKQLFGLPHSHFSYVRNIEPGLPLFLFNYSDRKLHGIFESVSHGQLNIDPHAWCDGGAERTAFPAQVRIQIKTECQPLYENDYEYVIEKNYFRRNEKDYEYVIKKNNFRRNDSKHFWFELDHAQTRCLIRLFKPLSTSHVPAIDPPNQSSHLPPSPISAQKQKKKVKTTTSGKEDKFTVLSQDKRFSDCGSPTKESPYVLEYLDSKDQVSDLEEYAEAEVHINMDQQPVNEDEYKMLKLQRSRANCKSNLSNNLVGKDTSSSVLEDLCDHNGQVLDDSCTLAVKDADFIADRCYHGNVIANSLPLGGSMEDVHQIALNCCDGKANRNSGKALLESCSMDNQEKDLLPANVSHLLETIRELKMRTTNLEKQQVESNGEILHLRHLLGNAGRKIQLLGTRLKDMESKVGPVLLDDCTGKLVEQYSGSDDAIYLVGGFNGSQRLSALETFSPLLDILTPLKSMSYVRSYASVVALDGFLYAVGGGDGVSWYDSVERYDHRNDEWTLCPKMLREKGSLAGAALNGKIYVLGGSDGSKCFSDVETYDPALGRWISSRSMFHKRFSPTAAELNGALYAVGGFDGQAYLTSAERFDPREFRWTGIASMTTRRGSHSMAVYNEKLYVMGGYDGKNMVASVEVYDPRASSWMVCEPLNSCRGYAACAVLGNSLFVIGGKDGRNIVETIECYEGAGWKSTDLKSVGRRTDLSAIVL